MDDRAIELYKTALEEGKEHNYNIRIMVTGPYGVGKSTFTKRLLYQDVDINDRASTDGIDVHVKKCKVSIETSQWNMNYRGTKHSFVFITFTFSSPLGLYDSQPFESRVALNQGLGCMRDAASAIISREETQ